MMTSYVYRDNKIVQNLSRQDLAKTVWDEKSAIVWVDLENPTEFESETLIEIFNFHELAIEDCLIDHGEPKIDDYEDYLFFVLHAMASNSSEEIKTNELDIFFGKNFVVTFHKEPVQSVAEVKTLVERKNGGPLADGTDMVVHAILDRLVDRYLPVLTEQDRWLDEIEDMIFNNPGDQVLHKILDVQKRILRLKRIIGPQRDKIGQLSRSNWAFIQADNQVYFRDVYDHLFKYYQMAEELHSLLTGILQVHFSNVTYQLNKAIKTMTILATISIPSVAIASIYGMNFKHMPELEWLYGYHFALTLMVATSVILLIWMKVKKWF